MFGRKSKSKEIIELDKPLVAGQIIPCNDPGNLEIVVKDQEPDLSTKPKDKIGYCFGYACADRHVGFFLDSITATDAEVIKACQTCGKNAKLCSVKKTAEAQWYRWVDIDPGTKRLPDEWFWTHRVYYPYGSIAGINWTKHEFNGFIRRYKSKKN